MFHIVMVAAAVSFPGGNANELAKVLSESFKQNVVIVESEIRAIPAFDFEAGNLNLTSQNLRAKTPLQLAPGAELAAHDAMVAPSIIGNGAPSSGMKQTGKTLTADELKDGKFTFESKGNERIAMSTLGEIKFSRPVKVHWIYNEDMIAAKVTAMPETDFLNYVAKAAGARLRISDKAFDIEVDPLEVRRRVIKTIEAIPLPTDAKEKAIATSGRELRVSAIQAMNTKQLADYLAAPGGTQRVTLAKGSSLINPATAYVKAMEANQSEVTDPTTNRRLARRGQEAGMEPIVPPNLLQRVDPNRPSYVVIMPNFQVSLEISLLGGQRVTLRV